MIFFPSKVSSLQSIGETLYKAVQAARLPMPFSLTREAFYNKKAIILNSKSRQSYIYLLHHCHPFLARYNHNNIPFNNCQYGLHFWNIIFFFVISSCIFCLLLALIHLAVVLLAVNKDDLCAAVDGSRSGSCIGIGWNDNVLMSR